MGTTCEIPVTANRRRRTVTSATRRSCIAVTLSLDTATKAISPITEEAGASSGAPASGGSSVMLCSRSVMRCRATAWDVSQLNSAQTTEIPGADAERVPPVGAARKVRPGFGEREDRELASYLRSAFRARRVERLDHPDRVEFRLYGKGDAIAAAITFERTSLEGRELTDLRSHLSRPQVRRRILDAGAAGVTIPDAELPWP